MREPTQSGNAPADDRMNILIVDDLPEKLLALSAILEGLGENVFTARSGEEALQQILRRDFAVILLDVAMPGMDGYETASLIRTRKRSAHTPIIFITGYHDELHNITGYSLGAVDYILSPVVPDILRTKVKVFVDLRRMTEEIKRHADQRIALAKEQAAREAAESMAEALRQSEERFRLASEAVNGFIYEIDLTTGRTAVSSGLSQLLGFAPEEAKNLEWCRERIHPADVDRVRAQYAALLQGTDHKYHFQYRVRHREGHDLYIWDQGLVLRGAQGRPLRLIGNAVDISEQKRAEQALAESARHKDEFLAMLAHELRNPLAPIRNAVQLLQFVPSTDSLLVQAREMIGRQVAHMVRLVDDLLDVSRLARGKMLLRPERLDLADLVRQAAEDYRHVLETSGLKLTLAIPSEPVWVMGDVTRLTQAIGNLLHNAHKFTNSGGAVHVSLAVEGERMATIRVRDTGIGLEPQILSRVFDSFTQADQSLDRSKGGLGLGLAVVKGLIELQGGTVSAYSAGLGQGAEFTIHLPCVDATPTGGATNGKSYRVLIIEDDEDSAESAQLLLGRAGHQVRIAPSGAAGLEAARSFRPQVVLCDTGLQGEMNGYDIARALRQDPRLSQTYFIGLTTYGRDENRPHADSTGFDLHLTKPVDFAALHRALGSLRLDGGRAHSVHP